MYSYNFDLTIFKDITDSYEEVYGEGISDIAITSGTPGSVKKLDGDFIPLESKFFEKDENGTLVLNIGALKEAIENYDPSPGHK